MKRILFVAFFVSVLVQFNSVSFAAVTDLKNSANGTFNSSSQNIIESSFYINAIDPTPLNNPAGAYYPGARAANQLVIYTSKYGSQTGTNEFGKEVVVINGVASAFSGSNSFIPKNGFILSGHGRAKDWINNNVKEGAKIELSADNKTVKSIITPDSYLYKANQRIIDVQNVISDLSVDNLYSAGKSKEFLIKANYYLNLAKKYVITSDLDKVKQYASVSISYSDKAFNYAVPAKQGEMHGVWLRPTEKNLESIDNTLDNLKKIGITNVFLETYYQGTTIFPSQTLERYGVTPQKKEFIGMDPLKIWTEEAHKRNMKIHVWFQTFYAGSENIAKNSSNVLSIHPDWANVQRRNAFVGKPTPSTSEHNGYFLDPANPQVQQYLLTLIREIVTNYNVDGLNIDYIRYPASLLPTFPNYIDSTWGYSKYARNEFQCLYGVDPVKLSVTSPLWQKWILYRQGKVTEFVSQFKSIVGAKNITISTVIFPDLQESAILKLQNWGYWGKHHYVDAFTPLVMGSNTSLAEDYVLKIKNNSSADIKIYPGLFEPFTGDNSVDMLKQLLVIRKAGASGVIIFDYAHLNSSDDYVNALKDRAFKE